jgi:hypothetical protein
MAIGEKAQAYPGCVNEKEGPGVIPKSLKACNHQHFGLLLEEINLSCSSVRFIVLEAAIRSPRKREEQQNIAAGENVTPEK